MAASDVQEPFLVEFASGVDGMPGFAQAKMAYQRYKDDHEGANETSKRFWTFSLGASQFASLQDIYYGNLQQALARQKQFLNGATRMLKAVPESMPLVGHIVGGVHCCVGNRDHGKHVLRRATRSCCVVAPGLLIGGASIVFGVPPQSAAQAAIMTAAAGIGGVAAGIQADVRLFLRAIPPQVGMTPGERFDLMVLRFLDGLKAVSCMDLVPVLWPDSIEQASVWTEPLSAQEAAHLLTGIKQFPYLEQIDTGALHAFVVIKTAKGHVLLTERLHDGQIVLGDATSPNISHFADGQTVFADTRAMMSDGQNVLPAMAVRMHMAEKNGASLFAVKEIQGGPSTAALFGFARAQSRNGYDLLSSNCQHYANGILEFASGKGLTYLPNGNMLSVLSSLVTPALPTVPFTSPGLLSSMAYEASLEPARVALDCSVMAIPREPPSTEQIQLPQQFQQLPLPELQRQLEQLSLQQRERLPPQQLQQLAEAAASQVPQMQGHRLYEDPEAHLEGISEDAQVSAREDSAPAPSAAHPSAPAAGTAPSGTSSAAPAAASQIYHYQQ